jgi:alginate O-acetyltransferase complex protein AlgI
MGSVAVDFFLVRLMSGSEGGKRRLLFWLSVALNLSLLLYFKYMNFFVDQLNAVMGILHMPPATWTKILFPLGISFITFQKLAYTFDVSKKGFEPFRKIQDYALYIFMFPQLLSGPIVRPGQLAPQILDRREQEKIDDKLSGFYRFIIGLAKKVLIADALAAAVDPIFALGPHELSTSMAWAGAVGYTFQIYFDFSGYTDMAIGLARMVGFRLPENFNNPYISKSITEFWRRWHITLSTWFRDYLFLPLAYSTSRKLPREKYFGIRADKVIYLIATSVTFLLCGFWHGAAWTFILWGVYQGFFLILDRLFLLKLLKKVHKVVQIGLNFIVLMFGWVLFRSDSLDDFHFYIRRMFLFVTRENDIWLTPKFWTMLVIAAFFSFWGGFKKVEEWQERFYQSPNNKTIISMSIVAILLFILCEAAITSSGFSPFIYFRF